MRVLALYSDDNGEARQAFIHLGNNDGTEPGLMNEGEAIAETVAEALPDYNSGGGLHLVELPEVGERPNVIDQHGNEVGCEFLELEVDVSGEA